DTPPLGRTHGRHCIPRRGHPRNSSSTLNQSRSAKPADAITSSPSPADFRTPTSAPSNLHSPQQPSYPTSRAFLHWRLSDDGPRARGATFMGPSSETLHKNGPDALEMGCLFYPRKQTSVSYAADCNVIVCS